jgi:hypothetical protein
MLNLTTNQATGSVWIYPDSASIYFNDPNVVYTGTAVQDLDLSSGSFEMQLINTPSSLNPGLVLQVYSGSGVPENTGQYTFTLAEAAIGEHFKWGTTHITWSDFHYLWSNAKAESPQRVLATDRLYINGTNTPQFTDYISPNENGAFTTYNG